MDPTAYTQAMKTMSARGWRKREPVDLGPAEKPVLLAKALDCAAAHGVTLADLAAEHGLPLHDLRRILQHSNDVRPPRRVVVRRPLARVEPVPASAFCSVPKSSCAHAAMPARRCPINTSVNRAPRPS